MEKEERGVHTRGNSMLWHIVVLCCIDVQLAGLNIIMLIIKAIVSNVLSVEHGCGRQEALHYYNSIR